MIGIVDEASALSVRKPGGYHSAEFAFERGYSFYRSAATADEEERVVKEIVLLLHVLAVAAWTGKPLVVALTVLPGNCIIRMCGGGTL